MRAIWITIAVFLLDQLTKLAIQFGNHTDSITFYPSVDGRYFYEVIHDRAIINSLRRRPNTTTA